MRNSATFVRRLAAVPNSGHDPAYIPVLFRRIYRFPPLVRNQRRCARSASISMQDRIEGAVPCHVTEIETSYAQKLVTGRSGGSLDVPYAVPELNPLDDLGPDFPTLRRPLPRIDGPTASGSLVGGSRMPARR